MSTRSCFREIFDRFGDAVFLLDPARDRILTANPAAAQMLGYTCEELAGKPISEIHPDEMPKFMAFARSVRRSARSRTEELTCLRVAECAYRPR